MDGERQVFRVDPRLVARRRAMYLLRWLLGSFGLLSLGLGLVLVFVLSPSQFGNSSPLLVVLLFALLLGAAALSYRWDSYRYRRINSPMVTTQGIAPPFKPQELFGERDWVVRYRDIMSMRADDADSRFWPEYTVSLIDGTTFVLSPYDILWYVTEREGSRYAAILDVIYKVLQTPQRLGAEAIRIDEIPLDSFKSATAAAFQ